MSSYRDNAAWRAAQADFIADLRRGETATEAFVRRLDAVYRMYAIEQGAS